MLTTLDLNNMLTLMRKHRKVEVLGEQRSKDFFTYLSRKKIQFKSETKSRSGVVVHIFTETE